MTLAEVKFNDRHCDSGYYTFSRDRFLVFSTDHSKGDASFVDLFCYLCFVFIMFSCLFIVALWSPAGKGLASRLSCM